jgi:hypothetical protein
LFSLDHAVNWEAISAIGQLVGALAVVISLIYLANEVRSNARATRLAARRATLDAFNLLSQQLIVHADLAELYNRGLNDYESLEGTDHLRFGARMHQMFRNVEDVYYQHLERHLDPRVWRGFEEVVRELNGYPGVQAWWRSHSHWFGEEFAKLINQLQQTAKAPRL